MNDFIRKAFALGVGITVASKEKVQSYVNELVKKGEVAPEQSRELVADLIRKGEEQQAEMGRMVKEQLRKFLADMHVATKEDVEMLVKRIERLEQNHS